jgi:hypothetical protein
MLSTKEDIRSALEAYRSHIAAHNRRALEIFIPVIANWVPDEDWELSEEEVLPEKLKSLSNLLQNWDLEEALVSDPTELLTRYEELVPLLDLDGVGRLRKNNLGEDEEGDKEYRALKINEYFTVIETALKEHSLEEVRGTIAIPEELRILSELGVDGLDGPGLGQYRSRHQAAFWTGPGEYGAPERITQRVKGPDAIRHDSGLDLLDEWVVAGGWETGHGVEATCCAVFCRRVDEKDFAWRYTVNLTFECDFLMFDTIPQLLDWYKDFRQESLDYIRDYDADEELLFMP